VDGPCTNLNTWPVWAVVAMALLSHLRGSVLVIREVMAFLGTFRNNKVAQKLKRRTLK